MKEETNANYIVSGKSNTTYEDRVLAEATEILRLRMLSSGSFLESPAAVRNYLKLKLGTLGHEIFGCIWLNTKHEVITFQEIFRGTIDGATVYPREVVKEALNVNAAAAVLVHNHPSGNSEPSHADKMLTNRLKESLTLMEVRVIDHIIIGKTFYSFAENGLI